MMVGIGKFKNELESRAFGARFQFIPLLTDV